MSGKDIRSFFFGGKPAGTTPVASTTKGNSSAKVATAEDPLLVDSDEEDKTTQRKRLKTTKQASAAVSIKSSASPPPPASHQPDRGHFQSPEPPRRAVKKETPTCAARTEDADDKPALSVLDVKKVMSPAKNLKEVKGGAAEFFGGASAVETSAPVGMKRSADTENTPTKVPRTSAGKAAVAKSPAAELKMSAVKSPPSAGSKRKASTATAIKVEPPLTPPASTAAAQGLCFEGLKIAVTGVFESCSREEVEDLILSHGGKVAAAVSGKTNYLVAGKVLEDGRPAADSSKYRAALEKKVQILSEEDFLERIARHEEAKQRQEESQTSVASAGTGVTTQATTLSNNSANSSAAGVANNAPPNPFAYKASSGSSSAAPVRTSTYTGSSGFGAGSSCSSSSSSVARPSAPNTSPSDQLWVDKYRPASSANMIGSTEIVTKLTNWLRRWDAVHLRKTEKVPFSKENPGARAALLSGPPGIGKSTVAALAAREGGYDVLELNASDTRNKREIEALLSDAVSSQAISAGGEVVNRKRLVIMDEVDGMGGSDRGGIAELIKVIKTSRIPIICICNDRQSTKIRSLVNHCYDLRVRRPTKQQIATRLVQIAKTEGMHLEQNAAEMLVEQVGNDIRQSLNSMQMWRAKSSSLSYSDMKSGMARIEKDKILRLTPFDACGTILGGSKAPLDDRYNAFFIDYSLTPLLIQHNYIDSAKNGIFKNPQLDDVARMQLLSKAADAVSDSDLAGAAIRGQNMHWELLTTQAVFCVRAGSFVQGFQGMASFPAWLGKYSAQGKRSRLTKEIVHHTALTVGQGFQAIRLDYVPYLRRSLLEAMQRLQAGACEVDAVVAALDAYGLTKEDFMENMRELQFVIEGDKVLTDQFASLDAKVKTSLTRAYNSTAHTSQVLVSELAVKAKKGRGGKGAAGGDDLDDEELLGEEAKEERALLGADEGEGEGEDSGPEDISALVSSKPKRGAAGAAGKKATAAAATGASSSSAAGKGRGKGKAAK